MENAPPLIAMIFLLISAQFPVEVLAKRPPPPPEPVTAADVVCEGCVGTTDIEDGSVTTQKLSAEVNALLDTINQLEIRLDTIDATHQQRGGKLIVVDANNERVGTLADIEWDSNGVLQAHVVFSTNGHEFYLLVRRSGFIRSAVRFDNWDCSGTPYVTVNDVYPEEFPTMLVPADIGNNVAYVPDIENYTGNKNQNFLIYSELESFSGQCNNHEGPAQGIGIPAVPILDLSDFVPPFKIITVQ